MIVTCVTIHVKPEHRESFIDATILNHEASVREPGNLRFDFLQAMDDPNRFFLYEAYASREASAAHKETAHYKEWKELVAPWMSSPREGVAHQVVRPTEGKAWKCR